MTNLADAALTRIEAILQDMERRLGHEFIAEPVNQLAGTAAFIPLWNAYRERDAEEVLRQLDKLAAAYWTPRAERIAANEEVEEEAENRERRRTAIAMGA